MKLIEMVIGTGNLHKAQEIRAMLQKVPHLSLVPSSTYGALPEIVEDGSTFMENAAKKAHGIASILAERKNKKTSLALGLESSKRAQGRAGHQESSEIHGGDASKIVSADSNDIFVIADDSGLVVDALDGAPGIYSARYAGKHGDDEANNLKLLKELEDIPLEKRKARFVCAIACASQKGTLFCVEGKVEGLIVHESKGDKGFGYDPLFFYPPYDATFGEVSAEAKNAVSHRANALKLFKSRLVGFFSDQGLIPTSDSRA